MNPKKKAQALIEYLLLTSIMVIIGVSITTVFTPDFFNDLYKKYIETISIAFPVAADFDSSGEYLGGDSSSDSN